MYKLEFCTLIVGYFGDESFQEIKYTDTKTQTHKIMKKIQHKNHTEYHGGTLKRTLLARTGQPAPSSNLNTIKNVHGVQLN